MPRGAQPLAWGAITTVATGSARAALPEVGAGGRGSKRRQVQGCAAASASQSSGSVSAELVHRLLRDHLHLLQKVGMNLQSPGLVVMFRSSAAKTAMNNLVQHYHEQAPERAQSGKQPPHPLGFRKMLLFPRDLAYVEDA